MKKTTRKKSVKTVKVTAVSKKSKRKVKKLTPANIRLLNIVFGLLLLIQAIAIVIFSDKQKGDVTLTANYLTRDPAVSDLVGYTVLAQATERLLGLNLAYLTAAFLILASVGGLVSATRYRSSYEAGLKAGENRFRWLGYIFSFGAVILTAALLVGLSDVTVLAALFVLIVVSGLAAFRAERQLQGSDRWSRRLAMVTGLFPVTAVALYIFFAHVYGGGLPLETLAVLGVLGLGLLMSVLALLNAYKLNSKDGKYLSVERTYLLFNFLVPTAFAWAIFSLLLQ